MEMNERIPRGMAEFVDFLHSLDRIKQKFPAESVIYTRLLEETDPSLVKWKSKTEVK
jgi:succinate dehydrogenase flavin-adding protein (antitoxin of CptAB toxin-antitoxin module)